VNVPLDAADRKIVLAAVGLFVLLTAVAVIVPNESENSSRGFPSSYSTTKDGAKAAYALLEETGYRVERWTHPPLDLPPAAGNTLLIIAGPSLPASSEETIQLRQYVARGGRLLVTGMRGAGLVDAVGVEPIPADADVWRTFAAEHPAPLTRHAPEISMQSDVRWVHPGPGVERYYGDKDGAAITRFRIGEGEVIWWADDSPLTNFGITKASNLALFLNSVGAPAQTRVLWDEYFHGVRLGFWRYFARTPLPWALLQLLALAAFVILTFARRSGATRPLTRESRLSPLEFVATLGALYQRRGEAAGALEIAFSHFRFLLSRRLGLSSTATTAELIRTMQGRPGWSVPGFAETLEQIESALKLPGVTESKALAWIGELYDYAARLGLEVRS
jgi:hypothetical protein